MSPDKLYVHAHFLEALQKIKEVLFWFLNQNHKISVRDLMSKAHQSGTFKVISTEAFEQPVSVMFHANLCHIFTTKKASKRNQRALIHVAVPVQKSKNKT